MLRFTRITPHVCVCMYMQFGLENQRKKKERDETIGKIIAILTNYKLSTTIKLH